MTKNKMTIFVNIVIKYGGVDSENCARFRKRFLITFFESFSENEENNRSCHENSFGYYANRHLRTYDLQ